MRKLFATLVVVSLLAALAIAATTASSTTAGSAQDEPETIRVADNRFRSGTLDIEDRVARVDRGTRVSFEWVGDNFHNVTGIRKGDRKFQSKETDETGFVYPRSGDGKVFRRTTRIICDVHPFTMRFKIKVRR